MRPLQYNAVCAVSGITWGVLAFAAGYEALGGIAWAGLIASPLIGVAIGWLYRPLHRAPMALHLILPIISLYVAAMLFGVAVGIGDLAWRWTVEGLNLVGLIPGAVLAVWWGLTFSILLILFGPMAILNHLILRQLDRRCRVGTAHH